jgi:hypothetical protein
MARKIKLINNWRNIVIIFKGEVKCLIFLKTFSIRMRKT